MELDWLCCFVQEPTYVISHERNDSVTVFVPVYVCVCAVECFFFPGADSSASLVFTYLGQRSPLENMHRYNCPFVKHQTSVIFLT